MIQCSECGSWQNKGTLFCSECGHTMLPSSGPGKDRVPFADVTRRLPPPQVLEDLQEIPGHKTMTFVIPGSRRRLSLELTGQIHVGRSDPRLNHTPELDLTEDRGSELGVSRRHATILLAKQGIALIDLDSTNGTMLNNYRLPKEIPHLVFSGDELRFGDLLVHIFIS